MEASVRILLNSSSNVNRRFTHSFLLQTRFPPNQKSHHLPFFPINPYRNPSSSSISAIPLISIGSGTNHTRNRSSSSRIRPSFVSLRQPSFNSHNSNPLGFFSSNSASSQIFFNPSVVPDENLYRSVSDSNEKFFKWYRSPAGVVEDSSLGFSRDRGPVFTVVLLGWLGAQEKHLKRYVELYAENGIQAVTFVVPVKDVLNFDLGRRVEKRISALTEELCSWLSDTERDGRERSLLFHTFSNTGWLAYGAVLKNLQCRGNFTERIKGCVIDSGGDPEINPKVWAAGFAAALLKKRSSATLPSVGAIEGNELDRDKSVSKMQENEPLLIEILLLFVLEKFFSFVLKLPDVNQRLSKIIYILSNNQPHCPQLYLYSTADRVIPYLSVDSFIQDQRKKGRMVWAYNFGPSPHVDHFRTFPHIYSEELHKFLKEIVSPVGQT